MASIADSGNIGENKNAWIPAFFVQKRVGKEGKLFDCHKFRTIKPTPSSSLKGRENGQAWSTVSRGIAVSRPLEQSFVTGS